MTVSHAIITSRQEIYSVELKNLLLKQPAALPFRIFQCQHQIFESFPRRLPRHRSLLPGLYNIF